MGELLSQIRSRREGATGIDATIAEWYVRYDPETGHLLGTCVITGGEGVLLSSIGLLLAAPKTDPDDESTFIYAFGTAEGANVAVSKLKVYTSTVLFDPEQHGRTVNALAIASTSQGVVHFESDFEV
jgi:hypothetical protein